MQITNGLIAKDTVEFTLLFDEMDKCGELMSWDEISDRYGDRPTTDILKDDFVNWAVEFQDYRIKYPNIPRLILLQEFAKKKIVEKYGRYHEYTVKVLIDTMEIKVMATSEEEAISKAEKTIENKYKCKPKQLWTAGDEKK